MKKLCFPFVGLLLLSACSAPVSMETTALNESRGGIVSKATPEWEEMLRRKEGWIGADGVYAVALNGVEAPGRAAETETLLWFSDNIWGNINKDTLADNWE